MPGDVFATLTATPPAAPARLRPARRPHDRAPAAPPTRSCRGCRAASRRSIAAADEPGAALTARVTLPVSRARRRRRRRAGGRSAVRARRRHRARPRPRSCAATRRRAPPASRPATCRRSSSRAPTCRGCSRPAAPGTAKTRLRPWLVLVTVRRQDGVRLAPNPGGPLPVLELDAPADPAAELPDLAQSWAWAHAQIAGLGAGARPADVLASDPGRACSRLVCPRRLRARHRVPGLPRAGVPGRRQGRARRAGDGGRRGEPRAGVGRDPRRRRCGCRCTTRGSSRPGPRAASRRWSGACIPARSIPRRRSRRSSTWRARRRAAGRPASSAIAERAARRPARTRRRRGRTRRGCRSRRRSSGRSRARPRTCSRRRSTGSCRPARARCRPPAAQPAWLRELNLDPRLRVAAAAGTRVVQERQEQLMARAWEQAGAVDDANALLRRSQLARELGDVVLERHLAPLSAARAAGDDAARARADPARRAQTVDAELRASRVPEAVVSGAMRRLASPQGLIARRAAPAGRPGRSTCSPRVDQVAMTPAARRPGRDGGDGARAAARRRGRRHAAGAVAPTRCASSCSSASRPRRRCSQRTRARVDAPAGTWTRPDPLAPVATGPRFGEPMYDGLQRGRAVRCSCPGVEHVEADGVALLETTPRVIEAYMAGLNHELSRELLWREFPADARRDGVPPVLGRQRPARRPRGARRTSRRSPSGPARRWARTCAAAAASSCCSCAASCCAATRRPRSTPPARRPPARSTPSTRLAPMFRGALAPDIVFVGFALSEESALGIDPAGPGWYFVFEEYPGEPRFGFDEVAARGVPKTAGRARLGARAAHGVRPRRRRPSRCCPPPPTLQARLGHATRPARRR